MKLITKSTSAILLFLALFTLITIAFRSYTHNQSIESECNRTLNFRLNICNKMQEQHKQECEKKAYNIYLSCSIDKP